METVTRITHIALIREGAVFLQRNVPAVGLIVDVILQMLWHLHNVQFFDVIAAQIVIVMFHLSRGKIFRYRTVTGHFLRDLIGRFQFPHRQSPSFP